MAKWSALWRLAGALVAATIFMSAGSGLMAAQRSTRKAPKPAAKRSVPTPKPKPSVAAPVPARQASASEIEIISPEQGAKLRGTALVKADYPNPMGYVMFRIDDGFAYATTPPYQMKWDTTSSLDGDHVVSVDAYDGSGRYVGSASIAVVVENAIPTPANGVLLTVRFNEHDMLTRVINARGEVGALAADETLPQGFDVLAGELRAEVTTTVMDIFYEGATTLIRSRLRTAQLTAGGKRTSTTDVGQYEMLQVSRNGLEVPVATATAKPRVGLAEMSFALRDFPVVPGDSWESPIGVVSDLYSRRAVFVEGRHVFEGLRWFRGKECAVITSTYVIPEVPIYSQAEAQQPAQQAAAVPTPGRLFNVELTGMGGRRGGMGGGMRGGGMRGGGARGGAGMRGGAMGGARGGAMGGARGGARGGAAARGGARGGAMGGGAGQRPGGGVPQLQSAQLVDLQGTRRTYLTRQTGRVIHTEDTILGQVQFRSGSQVAQRAIGALTTELTGMGGRRGGMGGGMRGGGMRGGGARGGAGMRGGAMGGARGGAMGGAGRGMRGGAGAAGGTARGRAGQGAAGQTPTGPKVIPAKLDYGFRLTTDLIVE
ncbi:MAG: hypothetical protein ACE149_10020 [Armatimonadota bacterium]